MVTTSRQRLSLRERGWPPPRTRKPWTRNMRCERGEGGALDQEFGQKPYLKRGIIWTPLGRLLDASLYHGPKREKWVRPLSAFWRVQLASWMLYHIKAEFGLVIGQHRQLPWRRSDEATGLGWRGSFAGDEQNAPNPTTSLRVPPSTAVKTGRVAVLVVTVPELILTHSWPGLEIGGWWWSELWPREGHKPHG
jgi:hypothetical protein